MLKLYELSAEYQKVFDTLEQEESMGSPALLPISQKLDEIQAPIKQKAMNVAKYINGLQHDQVVIDEEIKRLTAMKQHLKNREKSLQEYLAHNMKACEISKIETPLFKIQFRKCPVKVEVISEKEIPDEYKKKVTTTTIDKQKMRDDMKNGVVIPGAMLLQDEKIEIK